MGPSMALKVFSFFPFLLIMHFLFLFFLGEKGYLMGWSLLAQYISVECSYGYWCVEIVGDGDLVSCPFDVLMFICPIYYVFSSFKLCLYGIQVMKAYDIEFLLVYHNQWTTNHTGPYWWEFTYDSDHFTSVWKYSLSTPPPPSLLSNIYGNPKESLS